MKTLKIIETVEELVDLFKMGKLEGCKLIYEPHSKFDHIELQGTKEYAVAESLGECGALLKQMFRLLGIPVHIT